MQVLGCIAKVKSRNADREVGVGNAHGDSPTGRSIPTLFKRTPASGKMHRYPNGMLIKKTPLTSTASALHTHSANKPQAAAAAAGIMDNGTATSGGGGAGRVNAARNTSQSGSSGLLRNSALAPVMNSPLYGSAGGEASKSNLVAPRGSWIAIGGGGVAVGNSDSALAPGSALPRGLALRSSEDTIVAGRRGASTPGSSSRKMRRPRPPSGSIPDEWMEGKGKRVMIEQLEDGYSGAASRGVPPAPSTDEIESLRARDSGSNNDVDVVASALEIATVGDGAVRGSSSPANSYRNNVFKLFSHVGMDRTRREGAGENNDDDNDDGCWRSGLSLRSASSSKFAGDYSITSGHNVHREGQLRLVEDPTVGAASGVLPESYGGFTPSSYRDDDEGEGLGFFTGLDSKRSLSARSDVIGGVAGTKTRDGLVSSSGGGVARKSMEGMIFHTNDGGGVVNDAGVSSVKGDDDDDDDDMPPDLPAMTVEISDTTMEEGDETLPSYQEASAAALPSGRHF